MKKPKQAFTARIFTGLFRLVIIVDIHFEVNTSSKRNIPVAAADEGTRPPQRGTGIH
jgi:hypothetical protein